MEKLITLYAIASPSGREKEMAMFIMSELKRMGVDYRRDRCGNIYAVKGKSATYPCVVSHMDEVHQRKTGTYGAYPIAGNLIFGYDHRKKKMTGIGADDKNGIWICMKALEEFDTMKCVFFVQEETGCKGSRNADMEFFADCRYVLQCDRKGNGDIVTMIGRMELCSESFIRKICPERFGYSECMGVSTDVHMLKTRGLGISCVNLSCGYYKPHTDYEHTIWEDLLKCLRFVCHIVRSHLDVSPHLPQNTIRPGCRWFMEKDEHILSSRFRRSLPGKNGQSGNIL